MARLRVYSPRDPTPTASNAASSTGRHSPNPAWGRAARKPHLGCSMRTLLLVLLLPIPASLGSLRSLRRGPQPSDACRMLLLLLLLLLVVLYPERGPRHGCVLVRPRQASQQVQAVGCAPCQALGSSPKALGLPWPPHDLGQQHLPGCSWVPPALRPCQPQGRRSRVWRSAGLLVAAAF